MPYQHQVIGHIDTGLATVPYKTSINFELLPTHVPLNFDIPEQSLSADQSIGFLSFLWRLCSLPSAHSRRRIHAVGYSSGHKPVKIN